MALHPNADICTFPEGPAACEADSHGCMPCKLRRWRTTGLNLTYTQGRETFHDTTIREFQAETFAHARANGIEPEPAGVRWV